jgi:diguanylate cyclase (GGDEF)-like protein
VLRDSSDRKRSEERIRQLAHYDELTGLPNRTLLMLLLERALADARQKDERLAVLFIDMDRFKIVNDTLGHHVGDDVLKQVAQRLAGILGSSDSIARLGGDEFVVLMRHCDNTQRLGEMAQRILDTLAAPFILDSQEYHLSGSVGVSTYPDDSNDAQTLLRNADIAMYRAKENGKNAYQFHSAQMNVHSFERLVLERFLRRALEHDEFLLHYQPQIESTSGRVIGMEALLRWQNPAMGLISPAKFIPIAEETGLIVAIGEAVLRRACEDTIAWENMGLGPLRVAVNLSAHQLADEGLMQTVRNTLEHTRLDPSHLELEITESVVMQNADRAAALLRELRAMGLHLAIDDFGTGYSSLGYLKRFPVNTVKIDRSFITDIPSDPDDIAITRAVIAMAHSLRLQVTAEGVETNAQLDFLAKLGCEQMQGYLFSKPLPADVFESWLQGRRKIEAAGKTETAYDKLAKAT